MDQRTGSLLPDLAGPVRQLSDRWQAEPWTDERFPEARLDHLRATDAWHGFAHVEAGWPTDALVDVLRFIGRADLSLGRLFEGHVNALQLVTAYGSAGQAQALARKVERGALLGVWNTEPSPGGLRIVRLSGGMWRLEGAKSFATGAGKLDLALVTAKTEEGGKQLVLAPLAGEQGRADNRGWQVRGMRGTLSGRFDFSDMVVGPEALIGPVGAYEREPRFSAGAWRFTAVQLGAVEALARHWRNHLVAAGKAADPIQRARFGACLTAARSAGEWVRRAAQLAQAEAPEAVPFVLMTRGVVEEAGLALMEAAARSVGTASFFNGNPIDRITRDLGLYLRQPVPDQARDRAVASWLETDCWGEDRWW